MSAGLLTFQFFSERRARGVRLFEAYAVKWGNTVALLCCSQGVKPIFKLYTHHVFYILIVKLKMF